MAGSFSLSPSGYDSLDYSITTSNSFNYEQYSRFVITTGSTTNGSTTDPSGTYWEDMSPPDERISKNWSGTISGLNENQSYTLSAYVQLGDANGGSGQWWIVGSAQTAKTWWNRVPSLPTSINITSDGNDVTVNFIRGTNAEYTFVDIGYSNYYDGFPDAQSDSNGTSITFTVDSYGTWKFKLMSLSPDGQESAWSSTTYAVTTQAPPPEEPLFNSWSWVNKSLNQIKLNFTKGDDAYYTEVEYDGNFNTYEARTTSASSITITLPNYKTLYEIYIRSAFSSGSNKSVWQFCDYIQTDIAPVPTIPSSPVISSRFDGGVNISWGTSTYANYYTLQYKPNYLTTWTTLDDIDSTSYTINGMLYAVKYDFRVCATGSGGTSAYSVANTGTTLPKVPSISANGVTSSSISISAGSLPDNCDKVRVELWNSGMTSLLQTKYIDPSGRTFTSGSTSFTGLSSAMAYKVIAFSMFDANGDGTGTGTWLESSQSNTVSFTTDNRPLNWSWSYTIQSGGNVYQTTYSGSNLTAYIMTATEWNNFTSRINDFRLYKGLSTYTFTIVGSGSSCTPALINQAVSAINAMGFAISAVSAGTIPASVFIQMRDRLNSIL